MSAFHILCHLSMCCKGNTLLLVATYVMGMATTPHWFLLATLYDRQFATHWPKHLQPIRVPKIHVQIVQLHLWQPLLVPWLPAVTCHPCPLPISDLHGMRRRLAKKPKRLYPHWTKAKHWEYFPIESTWNTQYMQVILLSCFCKSGPVFVQVQCLNSWHQHLSRKTCWQQLFPLCPC